MRTRCSSGWVATIPRVICNAPLNQHVSRIPYPPETRKNHGSTNYESLTLRIMAQRVMAPFELVGIVPAPLLPAGWPLLYPLGMITDTTNLPPSWVATWNVTVRQAQPCSPDQSTTVVRQLCDSFSHRHHFHRQLIRSKVTSYDESPM